jgi:peptide/nickel transport system substrate-binding protein
MRNWRFPGLPAAFTAAVLLTAACTSGGANSDDGLNRPVADNVTGLTAVPKIGVLTKTAAEDPRRFEQARLIVEAWNAAGIPAELQAVRGAEVTRRAFTSKDFDAYVVTYDPTPERLDPDNFLARFISANAGDAGSNISGFRDRAFDKLYAEQRLAQSPALRRQQVEEAQKILYDKLPARPFAHLVVAGAYRSDRWDGIQKALGNPVFNVWNSIAATPKTDRKTLVVGTISDPPTLNPVTLETSEAQLPLSHIYDSLVRIGADGKLVNWAAQSLTTNGTVITVRLRAGMTFSDGKPVTADDVAFTIKYLVDKKSPLFGSKLDDVAQAVATASDTVQITLKQPSSSFVGTALSQMPILPKHVWQPIADPARFANAKPIGSGPFTFASRKAGSELRLTANKQHFSAPKSDGLVMTILGSFDAEVGALNQGDIDMLGDQQSVAQLKSVRDNPSIAVLESESFGWSGLHFNLRKAPFDDPAFREALSLLVPTQDIIDVALEGAAKPAGSVIAPTLTDWHDDKLQPYPTDPQRAMDVLGKAGYVFDAKGVLYAPKGK